MDFIRQSRRNVPALPADTILHESWQLTGTASANGQIITYLAVHTESGKVCRIAEYFPEGAAERSEDGLTAVPAEGFSAGLKRFRRASRILAENNILHLPEQSECFDANGTSYFAYFLPEGECLAKTEFPRTASYLRSLGIALCDTYIALHRSGLYYGTLSASAVLLHSDGTFLLDPQQILTAAAAGETDLTQDMHILTAFLSGMADGLEEDAEDPEELAIIRNVFRYSYQDAKLLRIALICEENIPEMPQTSRPSAKPLIRAAVCLLFLLAAAGGAFWLGRNKLPMGLCMKLGLVKQDVISVWMPMDTALDEVQTQEMYQKLVSGFERKYTGYGVDLVIYADDSFEEALDFAKTGAEPPTVFMNTASEKVQEMGADLSLLTASLDVPCLADLTEFETSIPLGCSLTALYCNTASGEEIEGDTIDFSEIDAAVTFDASAAPFLAYAESGTEREQGDFSAYLESRSEQPFLASTRCLALAERTAITSGAVRMLPVSVNGAYPLQYEMYCTVNKNKDWNSQRIGMLWLQYLLTEEAQQIMFAEYYSALPMHSDVLPQTLENHDALSVIGNIQPEIDSSALQ
ncbi:MAG: hypothetical protein IJ265_08300 [Oscillospiraceae bacterium]|nr:hypothetical protein [Oscillospiraceae bacterium]